MSKLIEGLRSKEVDSSATIIIQGGAGLRSPVNPNEVVALIQAVRKRLKYTRLIVQLEAGLQTDVEFIRAMVNMGVHDLQFTIEFKSDDILNWIKEKKTTRDYYNILGKKKWRIPFIRSASQDQTGQGAGGGAVPPPDNGSLQSLTRPQPSGASGGRVNPPSPPSPSGSIRNEQRSAPSTIRPRTENPLPLQEIEQDDDIDAAPVSAAARIMTGSHLPLIIGVCGVGGEEDVGAAAFLMAAGLVKLGWKPLVCGDDRPEISSLEEVAFDGEKEDSTSKMFEYEGVTFFRRGYMWDISELMTSGFTHIILWVDIHKERRGISALELWWNSQIPIMVGNGAMWKYELLKEKLNTLTPHERKRCRLLLEKGHQDVLRKLKKDFADIQATLLPDHDDPLYPSDTAVEWASELLGSQKKLFRKPVINWIIIGAVIFITLLLVFMGIAIVPESQ
ncbi:hypothetical protein BBD42_03985 [Paenibacillus sp. BIHB 4019]|uniref:Uncharacterized protein n=1 Tax=Paenibacillus sp. BIHB 4019 TaxID=1870819 RepID=A0A1B2DDE7_9BACL|nr:hypothetical protein [Paenibacillus sp. BIHB 4019]ANY65716.1 hypothetical protein BBD42_03985 [Paenibacillus sp. BIHB 4019]